MDKSQTGLESTESFLEQLSELWRTRVERSDSATRETVERMLSEYSETASRTQSMSSPTRTSTSIYEILESAGLPKPLQDGLMSDALYLEHPIGDWRVRTSDRGVKRIQLTLPGFE